MNAVVVTPEDQPMRPVAEGSAILAVISRAASDPNTDVDKMERLMGMYERIESRRAQAEFAADLAEMQDTLPSIGERGNAAGRYTYALWEDINAAIKPIMKRFGFALSFRTDCTNGVSVTGVLTHRSGHREETTINLPADGSGNKNAVQAVASSVSYGKRYT
ncbi:ERF family protein, partial [Bacillus altitudinis]